MTLRETKNTALGKEYSGSDGETYLLRAVDRQYGEKTKKPVYYLQKKVKGRFVYLSGVFTTPETGVFSLDFKDSNGIRTLYTLELRESGSVAELYAGKAKTLKKT